MDGEEYKVDFAFLEKDKEVLAVLLFGSGAQDKLNNRSDRDFCIVAPKVRNIAGMRSLLKKVYVNLDVVRKRYDVWLFEELPLYMKLQVIENHKIVFCRDLPTLYEYFYFYRKIGADQKHRQEMDKEELLKVLEK
ncbi:MAG: nucleotidyltransferase domain-containing protein [Methanophagales archaeon]|nr:nucleotidyltransferase domain-containing protein [Methanophagales archaeon]MCW3142007.1 nucleotidyltransferase domain-containing protein [Methanophagales archaeon]